jgi:hypothetical protein
VQTRRVLDIIYQLNQAIEGVLLLAEDRRNDKVVN